MQSRSKETCSLPEQRQRRCVWRSITDFVVFKTLRKYTGRNHEVEVGTPEGDISWNEL
jgi:hypothetical protein